MASHKQITDRDVKVKGVHIVERNEIHVMDAPKQLCISPELEELHEMHQVGVFVQRSWMQYIFGIGPEDNTRAMPASRLIHPLSNFGIAWVFTTAFFLVYTAIVTPPIISFSWLDPECTPNPTLYFDLILDIFFLLDILVAFNTGVKITGDYIDDRKTVAKIYVMSGALLFDLVTSFPVSFFELAVQAVCTSGAALTDDNSGELKIIRAIKPLRWFKIIRLMKLGKFGQTLDFIMDALGITPNLGNVLKSYSTFVLMIHLLACIWWLWKVLSQTPEETLLFLDDISWGSYGRNDLVSTQGKIEAYVIAVYITAQTLTTVGYGDITPENTSERVGYTLFFIINAFLWGNVLAEITSIHQADNEEKRVKMEFLQNTAQFLIKNDCPGRLRTQIIKWARINAEHKTEAEGKKDMIHKLPSDLQKGLVFHLFAKEVSTVPVFRFLQATTGSDGVSVKKFLSSVFAHLEYKMYMPGEVLVNFSSPADRLIFFINSIVEVEFDHPTINRSKLTLKGSNYIGDMTLVGDHDWASTTCFYFTEETDEITEILVTASGDYVMALELKAQVFQDALHTSPQAQAAVFEFQDSWRKGRAKRNKRDEELSEGQLRAIRHWERLMMPIQQMLRHARRNGPQLSVHNLKVLNLGSASKGLGSEASLLAYVDNQEADEGPESYDSDAAAARAHGRATLGAPRVGGRATLEAPTDLYGLAGLLQSQAKAHDTAMKRMAASIASLVSVQTKHSQALARIEALVGKQTVAGKNKPGYSAAAASKSSRGAKSKESVDSQESVRPAVTTPLAQLEKEIDEAMSPAHLQYAMSRGNTAASINTGHARPITQGGPISYSSDAEIFLGRLQDLGKEKAIETIIQGMSEHVHNAQVQERACKVLFMLAESAENQVQIACAGGIESVRAAMAAHLKAARVQEQACGALRNLAVDSDNQLQIAGEGGLQGVVAAMAEHIRDERVQEQACGALRNLAVNADNKERIAREGGIELVVAAMSALPKATRVQEQACGTLCNLAGNTENQARIAAAGGIERVVAAMAAHPQALGLQQRACAALWALAFTAENQAKIANAGGTDRVLACMAAHPSAERLQQKACGALNNLALHADNQAKIVGAEGIERLLSTMSAHGKSVALLEQACLALGSLSMSSEVKHAWEANSGKGVQVVVGAMAAHPHVARLQEAACRVLLNLSQIQPSVAKIIKKTSEGKERVKHAMAAQEATENTKAWAQRLLKILEAST